MNHQSQKNLTNKSKRRKKELIEEKEKENLTTWLWREQRFIQEQTKNRPNWQKTYIGSKRNHCENWRKKQSIGDKTKNFQTWHRTLRKYPIKIFQPQLRKQYGNLDKDMRSFTRKEKTTNPGLSYGKFRMNC